MGTVHLINGGMVEGLSLDQLATKIMANANDRIMSRIDYALAQGELLSAAHKICEDPNCGIEGENPKSRFGRWVSVKFTDTLMSQKSSWNYRSLWESWGHIPTDLLFKIGLSNCYKLRKHSKDDQQKVINAARGLGPDKGTLSEKDIKKLLSPSGSSLEPDKGKPRDRDQKFGGNPDVPSQPKPVSGHADDAAPDVGVDQQPGNAPVARPVVGLAVFGPVGSLDGLGEDTLALYSTIDAAGVKGITLTEIATKGRAHRTQLYALFSRGLIFPLANELFVSRSHFDDPPVNPATLSEKAQQTLERALNQQRKKQDHEFDVRVLKAAEKYLEDIRYPMLDKQIKDLRVRLENRKGHLTAKQFRLVLACLHPDQSQSEERRNEAFRLFNELKIHLLSEKEDGLAGSLPVNIAEFIRRKGSK